MDTSVPLCQTSFVGQWPHEATLARLYQPIWHWADPATLPFPCWGESRPAAQAVLGYAIHEPDSAYSCSSETGTGYNAIVTYLQGQVKPCNTKCTTQE